MTRPLPMGPPARARLESASGSATLWIGEKVRQVNPERRSRRQIHSHKRADPLGAVDP
jgi:hypothetical protein